MTTTDFRTRVQQLPTLADTFGPAFTLGRHAMRALKSATDPRRVNWDQVHKATIVESIEQHGQDPEDVHAALSKHSPGATSDDAQEKLRGIIDELAPDLARRYDQAKARQDAEYAAQKAANGGRIKFLK
ncbi:hypothetical protein O9X90_26395 [Agrobacterium leguminum]|uniref:hypothetical protein n=1 Tax=Agrobacterium leguminum TaxID=2792015 RepID=UPI0022B81BE0|nr:hypothetical protein [Agrobacterium leguminum]MCZ7935859.1 hypothetical protein [Agrobacterium leguminum]